MQTPSESLLSLAEWLDEQGNKYDSNGSTAFAYFRGASEARVRAKQFEWTTDPAQTLAYFNEREAFLAGQRSKETK